MRIKANRWINSLPKINKDNSIKRYSLIVILFVIGLMLASVIKNETRNIQKEINYLQTSINILKFDIYQATLDHEVITSPENISRLAKEYLESDLVPYNKSQIKKSNEKVKNSIKFEETKYKKNFKKKSKELPNEMKSKVVERIEEKKIGLRKLKEHYSKPEKSQSDIKLLVTKNTNNITTNLKSSNSLPKDSKKIVRLQKWAGLQIVKALLGMPIIPGK